MLMRWLVPGDPKIASGWVPVARETWVGLKWELSAPPLTQMSGTKGWRLSVTCNLIEPPSVMKQSASWEYFWVLGRGGCLEALQVLQASPARTSLPRTSLAFAVPEWYAFFIINQ